jgi:NAD(P)-dependent dehydrogenase (short-subunit alcohol dehydrogenase family)
VRNSPGKGTTIMGRLENKVAVITGAASGIGRASAVRFAGEGAAVVIADLNQDGGESAVRDCKEHGGRAVFQRADVSTEADVQAMIARAVNEFGGLDIIYNNAGLAGALGPLEQTTVENWDRTLAVLLRGVFLGIKHAVPEMRKRGRGSIISTASVAGLQGFNGLHAYCAAKAGVINLTRSAAGEFGKDRIRVNCICPGVINTPLAQRDVPGGRETVDQLFKTAQPYPRTGLPDDIAAMALFLASDDSEWVTGQAMVVDGGLVAVNNLFGQLGAVQATGATFSGPSFERRQA